MQALTGNNVYLRALEPEDLEFLYAVENDLSFWEVSSTETPYSKHVLRLYLENAHLDIYEAKQLRLVIAESKSQKPIGLIDLFDYNPKHKRAGVGILLIEGEQQKGYGSEALKLLIEYSFRHLNIHQLFANITMDNEKSLNLFKKHNFIEVGVKKDWIFIEGKYKDEGLFQLINV
ncbi:N-acetyltransferase [Aureibaculum marinum]|uniref:N-acetyltransferase n=1 Tax=Aureibaculum marinum TaxID=2487930 RepID=A0A3N4PMW6_9FLAO|nr:GNAT family protein [Aureibaculum marinum]RPE00904.1 N-acetyltransferase [Aureibaculum marinum]